MTTRTMLLPGLLLFSVGALFLLVRPAETAASKPASEGAMAYVDLQQVLQQAPAALAVKRDLADFERQLESGLEFVADSLALSEGEQKELKQLQAKKTPTEKDKSRIGELRGKKEGLAKELVSLQQKASPTATDTARLQTLTRLFSTANEQLEGEERARRSQLAEKRQEMMAALQGKILKAVEGVAKEQGLGVVVDRQALLFGGLDITPQVVKRLQK